MKRSKTGLLFLLAVVCMTACNPALNWRQLSLDSARVQLLLPCKADHASREVTLRAAKQDIPATLQLQGCEASGMQFTFGQMKVPQEMSATTAMAAWKLASLAPLQIEGDKDHPSAWQLQGAREEPRPMRTKVITNKHQAQFVWFSYGDTIYQAAVYGNSREKDLPDAAETYFSGIKLP
jgi:hypothetical protein